MIFTIIGYLAAFLTTFASLPQLLKVVKTKQTRDISLYMYLANTSGVFLWLVYGISIRDYPLIFANSIALLFVSIILGFKLKFK